MVNSYEEIMGTPMDPEDHSANNMKAPTQQYAGDVTPIRPAGSLTNIKAQLGQHRNEQNQGTAPPGGNVKPIR